VNAVTHRKNPIFHTIVGGGLEHLLLGAIPREATILATLQRSFPGVQDVHLSLGGVGRYHLYIKLKKTQHGEAKNVLLGAFAAHYDIKYAVAVDPRNTSVLLGSSNDYCGVYNANDADGHPIPVGPIWLGYYRSENAGSSFSVNHSFTSEGAECTTAPTRGDAWSRNACAAAA